MGLTKRVWAFPSTKTLSRVEVSVSVSTQDGIVALGKANTRSASSLSSPPKVALETASMFVWLKHRSFSTLEFGVSAASFLHSSFLQAISAVMLRLVRVEKVPQASEHLCPAKLQTRCDDICCACQSICPFIPTDSSVPRTVEWKLQTDGKLVWRAASTAILTLRSCCHSAETGSYSACLLGLLSESLTTLLKKGR